MVVPRAFWSFSKQAKGWKETPTWSPNLGLVGFQQRLGRWGVGLLLVCVAYACSRIRTNGIQRKQGENATLSQKAEKGNVSFFNISQMETLLGQETCIVQEFNLLAWSSMESGCPSGEASPIGLGNPPQGWVTITKKVWDLHGFPIWLSVQTQRLVGKDL